MLPAFFLANRTSRRIARFGSGFLESVLASASADAWSFYISIRSFVASAP
jgi:hypothetical protein